MPDGLVLRGCDDQPGLVPPEAALARILPAGAAVGFLPLPIGA